MYVDRWIHAAWLLLVMAHYGLIVGGYRSKASTSRAASFSIRSHSYSDQLFKPFHSGSTVLNAHPKYKSYLKSNSVVPKLLARQYFHIDTDNSNTYPSLNRIPSRLHSNKQSSAVVIDPSSQSNRKDDIAPSGNIISRFIRSVLRFIHNIFKNIFLFFSRILSRKGKDVSAIVVSNSTASIDVQAKKPVISPSSGAKIEGKVSDKVYAINRLNEINQMKVSTVTSQTVSKAM